MRIITKPTVTLISAPHFFGHSDYKIPEDGTPVEKLGAFAAKSCYDSFLPKGRANRDNQRDIIEQLHGSVLEHANVTLFIEGITRACSHEVVRHRHFSYSQRSTRYVAEEDGAIVLEPYFALLWRRYGFFLNDRKIEWQRAMHRPDREYKEIELVMEHVGSSIEALSAYERQVEMLMELNPEGKSGFDLRKWARGKARNILPHSTETRITMSGNFRAWRHFIEERSGRGAEPEIRRLANAVMEVLSPLAPTYFEDYRGEFVDGFYEWTTATRKV